MRVCLLGDYKQEACHRVFLAAVDTKRRFITEQRRADAQAWMDDDERRAASSIMLSEPDLPSFNRRPLLGFHSRGSAQSCLACPGSEPPVSVSDCHRRP
jgi:hypothetical protein